MAHMFILFYVYIFVKQNIPTVVCYCINIKHVLEYLFECVEFCLLLQLMVLILRVIGMVMMIFMKNKRIVPVIIMLQRFILSNLNFKWLIVQ